MTALQLTTSAGEHFAIRTELDTVNGTVMTLEHFPLFACQIVNANPFVAGATGHKAVLQDGMNGR